MHLCHSKQKQNKKYFFFFSKISPMGVNKEYTILSLEYGKIEYDVSDTSMALNRMRRHWHHTCMRSTDPPSNKEDANGGPRPVVYHYVMTPIL